MLTGFLRRVGMVMFVGLGLAPAAGAQIYEGGLGLSFPSGDGTLTLDWPSGYQTYDTEEASGPAIRLSAVGLIGYVEAGARIDVAPSMRVKLPDGTRFILGHRLDTRAVLGVGLPLDDSIVIAAGFTGGWEWFNARNDLERFLGPEYDASDIASGYGLTAGPYIATTWILGKNVAVRAELDWESNGFSLETSAGKAEWDGDRRWFTISLVAIGES